MQTTLATLVSEIRKQPSIRQPASTYFICRLGSGIIDAIEKGIVTSISILVNGSAATTAAVACIPSRISIGLHFNLTEGTLSRS